MVSCGMDELSKLKIFPPKLTMDKLWKSKMFSSYVPVTKCKRTTTKENSTSSIPVLIEGNTGSLLSESKKGPMQNLSNEDHSNSGLQKDIVGPVLMGMKEEPPDTVTSNISSHETDSMEEKIQCLQCDTTVRRSEIKDLLAHIRVRHGGDAMTEFRLKQTNFFPFKCFDCEYCFATKSVFERHVVEIFGKNGQRTKCKQYSRLVKRYRKSIMRMVKRENEDEIIPFEAIVKSSFQCPLKRCTKRFSKIDEVVHHVEGKHSSKEFIVFMTGDDFFDFLGKRCCTCDFLYLSSEMHSGSICAKYRELKKNNKLTNTDFHRVLNQMVDGGLLLNSKKAAPVEASVISSPSEGGKDAKRRRKRNRKHHEQAQESVQKLDSGGSDDSSSDIHETAKPLNLKFSNSLYHRCPVIQCKYKTLKGEDSSNLTDINHHLRLDHYIPYVVFNQTKFPHTDIHCSSCYFWFQNNDQFENHFDLDCEQISQNQMPLERLDEIFDINIMHMDYGYQYNGILNSRTHIEDENINEYLKDIWYDCPILGCEKMKKRLNSDSTSSRRKYLFREHLENYHPQEKYKLCTASFQNEEAAPFRCHKCNWFFFKRRRQREHMQNERCDDVLKTVHDMIISNVWDKIQFKSNIVMKPKQEIDDIVRLQFGRENISELACPACELDFENINLLNSHIESRHGRRVWLQSRRNITSSRPIMCYNCSLCFQNNETYLEHISAKYCELYQREIELVGLKDFVGINQKPGSLTIQMSRLPAIEVERARNNGNIVVKSLETSNEYLCPCCDEIFTSNLTLRGHIHKLHTREQWISYCTKIVPSVQEHRCLSCNFVFQSVWTAKPKFHQCLLYASYSILDVKKENLSENEEKAAKKHPCPECQVPMRLDYNQLNRHILLCHGRKQWVQFNRTYMTNIHELHCLQCGYFFSNNRYRNQHDCEKYQSFTRKYCREDSNNDIIAQESIVKPQEYKEAQDVDCPYCHKRYSGRHIYAHMKKMHSLVEWAVYRRRLIPGTREIRCEKCRFVFRDYQQLTFHDHLCAGYVDACKNLENENGTITIENAVVDDTNSLDKSVETPISGEIIISDQDAERSKSSATIQESETVQKVKEYTCPNCSNKYSLLQDIHRHIKQTHGTPMWIKYRTAVIPNVQEYICKQCKFAFETRENSHETKHECDVYQIVFETLRKKNVFNYFECPECLMPFKALRQVYDHLRSTHTEEQWLSFRLRIIPGIQEYTCSCGFVFQKRSPHNCNLYKDIVQNSELAKELLKKRGFDFKPGIKVKCPCCPELKYGMQPLYIHVSQKHGETEWFKLRTNKLVGYQEFQCSVCTVWFKNKDIMKYHNCKFFLEKGERLKIGSTKYAPQNGINAEYSCPKCGDVLNSYDKLNTHVLENHDFIEWLAFRTKPIPNIQDSHCETCDFYFDKPTEHDCDTIDSPSVSNTATGPIDTANSRNSDGTNAVVLYNKGEKKLASNVPVSSSVELYVDPALRCPECNKSNVSVKGLSMHLKRTHGTAAWVTFRTKKIVGLQEWRCPKCLFFCATKTIHTCREYQGYYAAKLTSEKIAILKREFETSGGTSIERIENLEDNKCPACKQYFLNFIEMDKHYREKHDLREYVKFRRTNENFDEKCNICRFVFPTIEDYEQHLVVQPDYGIALCEKFRYYKSTAPKKRNCSSSDVTHVSKKSKLHTVSSDTTTGSEDSPTKLRARKDSGKQDIGSTETVTDNYSAKKSMNNNRKNFLKLEWPFNGASAEPTVSVTESSSGDNCNNTVSSDDSINSVRKPKTITEMRCPYCITDKTKYKYDDLISHISTSHANFLIKFRTSSFTIQSKLCRKCKYYFPTRLALSHHNKIEHKSQYSLRNRTRKSSTEPGNLSDPTSSACSGSNSDGDNVEQRENAHVSDSAGSEKDETRAESLVAKDNIPKEDLTKDCDDLKNIEENNMKNSERTTQFNKPLHQIVLQDKEFKCFMLNCTYNDNYKDVLRHLREVHGDAYLIYRYRMLSIYGIMGMRCADCKYEFLTKSSFKHHKDKGRCEIYQKIQLPTEDRQMEIITQMRPTLSYSHG